MPELPEVETIVRDLNKSIRGKTIVKGIVHDPLVIRTSGIHAKKARPKSEDFTQRIKGQTIEKITRRGKAVIVHLVSGNFLVVQLMMTGQLIINGTPDRHTRVEFHFSDGTGLLYNDQRRFGQLRLVEDLNQIAHFKRLGPEPFSKEFTPAFLREFLNKTSRPIKNVLLDHTVVAGIGNIYACEILFRSKINPKRPGEQIILTETKAIHQKIIEVLKEAILHRGSSMRNYRDAAGEKGRFNERLSVYGRQGLPCMCCQKPVQRITQAGRSTFYCLHCQK